jgi:hypothetical protein
MLTPPERSLAALDRTRDFREMARPILSSVQRAKWPKSYPIGSMNNRS